MFIALLCYIDYYKNLQKTNNDIFNNEMYVCIQYNILYKGYSRIEFIIKMTTTVMMSITFCAVKYICRFADLLHKSLA